MPIVQRSYLRPGFPVFSFLCAWYADEEYARVEREAFNANPGYRGFLDYYKMDPMRVFSPGAEAVVVDMVATNPIEPSGGHKPTRAQSWALMPFLAEELANLAGTAPTTPPPPVPVDRTVLAASGERPLLSCLGAIFLNQDRVFRDNCDVFFCDFGLSDESLTTLRSFATSGSVFLTHGQVFSLSGALVDELTKSPATW